MIVLVVSLGFRRLSRVTGQHVILRYLRLRNRNAATAAITTRTTSTTATIDVMSNGIEALPEVDEADIVVDELTKPAGVTDAITFSVMIGLLKTS